MEVRLRIRDNISADLERKKREIARLPKQAFEFFRDETPVRTGNARRKTRYKNKTIVAGYPYAQKLDDGYSKQAPKGMTNPTLQFIRRTLNRLMRRR